MIVIEKIVFLSLLTVVSVELIYMPVFEFLRKVQR